MARVNSNVHVVHPERGVVWLRPGDRVPSWASGQIRRPELLDDEPDEEPSESDTGEVEPPAAQEPPRAGPGATAAAWRAFLTHPDVGVEVAEGASRAEMMDAWDAHNAPEDDGETEGTAPATGDGSEPETQGTEEPSPDDTGDTVEPSEPATGKVDTVEEPPRSGRGSGEDAWRAFADAKDVEVPDDASRDDIVELLEAQGVIAPADTTA